MLWAWFGGLDVLVDVVYRFEGKRQHNYKNYCGQKLCNTRCGVQIYDAV